MDTTKINLHTHTIFCDGSNTAEEMVISAINKGFSVLGFSGHSMLPFGKSWHIAPKDFHKYEEEILGLKEKYADKIQILYGYEADYFPGISSPSRDEYNRKNLKPDYIIGSVHYISKPEGHFSVDHSVSTLTANLIRLYGTEGKGLEAVDGKKVVCDYFEAERQMLRSAKFEILGHPDLVRKRNGELKLFTENESWYKEQLMLTAKEAARAGVIAEINTGAIARGIMDDVYPSAQFLEYLHNEGVPVCINSDAHNPDQIDCAYEKAKACAKQAGYNELTYPVLNKLVHIQL